MAAPGLIADDADPRLPHADYPVHMLRKLHDPKVTFQEYIHFASITRAEEHENSGEKLTNETGITQIFKKKTVKTPGLPVSDGKEHPSDENLDDEKRTVATGDTTHSIVTIDEWEQASRAGRTATWGAVFYLITTDILGPYSAPWAMSQLGYGPGAALYIVFGAFAGYGGYLLWKMFLGLDSHKFPLKTYGDIAYRIYGPYARHMVNILQSFQLIMSVALIIISNGQSLSQMDKGNLCFIIGCFIWAIAGAIVGQIRTLRNIGWLANFAVWLNVFIMIFTMAIVAHTPPNFVAAFATAKIPQGPVLHSGGVPEGIPFTGQIVGLMQAVFSYGGAMLFVEFMAEMRRPWDFWKGMLSAQLFIFCVYLFFGLFVYSQQGQFTINPAFQGISSFAWQTVGNAISLVSGLIAALLYGNVGIKVIYTNVLVDFFKAPPLETTRGKWLWIFIVPIYWSFAFIIGGAIPQISNLSAFVAAVAILQFSYTFPPWLMIGYLTKIDAMQEGEGFDAATGQTILHDRGMSRYWRGYKKRFLFNTFNLFFCLGSAATACLGLYSAGLGMKEAYTNANLVSFSCNSPVGS